MPPHFFLQSFWVSASGYIIGKADHVSAELLSPKEWLPDNYDCLTMCYPTFPGLLPLEYHQKSDQKVGPTIPT